VATRAVGRRPGFVLVAVVFGWMVHVAGSARWVMKAPGAPAPTTYGIGEALLTQYALPFEVASIVLLAALIGAVVVSRKEVKG
jgi:NADH-quinone oxidoreductase subunit J